MKMQRLAYALVVLLATSLLAPWSESTYTEAPVMVRSRIESACTETKMSAFA